MIVCNIVKINKINKNKINKNKGEHGKVLFLFSLYRKIETLLL